MEISKENTQDEGKQLEISAPIKEKEGEVLVIQEKHDNDPKSEEVDITKHKDNITNNDVKMEGTGGKKETETSKKVMEEEEMDITKQNKDYENQNAKAEDENQNAKAEDNVKDGTEIKEQESAKKENSDSEDFEYDLTDPRYAYISQGFTTEIFKIVIQNIDKRTSYSALKKKLASIGVFPRKIKYPVASGHAFINLGSTEERRNAKRAIRNHERYGEMWVVENAKATPDPLQVKRHAERNEESSKRPKMDTTSPEERIKNATTPLWKQEYEEQLKTKFAEIRSYMVTLCREMEKKNVVFYPWFKTMKKENDGLGCKLHPIKQSPIVTGYRNKCEFTIGKDPDGKDKTLGFRLSSYKDGCVTVVEPSECLNVSDTMKSAVKVMQDFLWTSSKLSSFNPIERAGCWRQVTVRTNEKGDSMIVAVLSSVNVKQTEIDEEMQNLKEYFENGPGKSFGVTSLYIQIEKERTRGQDPSQEEEICLLGEKYICESMLGLKFQVSPKAFFQVNTQAAEVLYSCVGDWCNISEDTTLLDVCCGTGTIGLTMAKRVKKVIGIEISPEAIEDAEKNAKLNKIENAEFHCGKAEEVLHVLHWKLGGADVVAVVDPPRAGLHPDVVKILRNTPNIKRIVYVSCKPAAAQKNIIDLTRQTSSNMRGVPFKVMEAIPVDLFPHTSHTELVLRLER